MKTYGNQNMIENIDGLICSKNANIIVNTEVDSFFATIYMHTQR